MKAVILAAGQGVRMRPETTNTPKPLIQVKGQPLLSYTFSALPDEVNEVIVVIGYLGEKIKKFLGKTFSGKKITYILQKRQLGTGHALYLCKHLLGKEKFLVLMADDLYSKKDLQKMVKYDLAVLAKTVKNPQAFGVIKLKKDKSLDAIIEKPQNLKKALANTGVFILDSRVFNYPLVKIPGGEYGLPQQVALMAQDFPVKVILARFWQPISCLKDISKVEKIIASISNF